MASAAKRYASAFLDVAAESKVLDAVGGDLVQLERLLDESGEFEAFVAHPLIAPEDQVRTLEALFNKGASPLTLDFLKLLSQRDRLADLAEIVKQALEQWRERTGILPVEVVSAEKWLARQEEALVKKLGERTGKKIELSCTVDERLIGGFRLKIGDQVEDHSLAAKLETFKRNVINA
ncbi:MAG: ATP synthase F1 subunit delta [Kiritimatiellia bacterium]